MNQRQSIFLSVTAAAILVIGWLLYGAASPSRITSASLGVPVVMHTSGGRLEVATVRNTDAFVLAAPPKTLLGIDLGQTVSHVQADVVYRYYIEMAKEWPIEIRGGKAIVQAGELKASLPVAVDTATLKKQTKSGWARFDKHENLSALESQLSPELERRAQGYKHLAADAARTTVAQFVRTWLIKERQWGEGFASEVLVLFPGERPVDQTASSVQ